MSTNIDIVVARPVYSSLSSYLKNVCRQGICIRGHLYCLAIELAFIATPSYQKVQGSSAVHVGSFSICTRGHLYIYLGYMYIR